MSLETVLQIGKVLRSSENSLKYFKYVEPCPKDKDGNWPICITIPVNEDFSFDWEGLEITPENQFEKLYYLRYSTSDNDSSPKKYLFGDICYTRKTEVDKKGEIKGIKDFGNFTFEKGLGNAFLNGQKTYEEIIDDLHISMIKTEVFENVGEKSYGTVMKFILSYYKSETNYELPKKLIPYSQIIKTAIDKLKLFDAENDFVLFHEAFKKDLEKIKKLLLFAPVFEFYMYEKDIVKNSLSNLNILHEYYLNVIKSKSQGVLKRLLKKDEKLESYSNETKTKFLQFADFTVFVHFKFFKDGKTLNWYQHKMAFDCIKDKLNSEVTFLNKQGLVPSKSIYRTLCSGNDKNDIQFPSFGIDNSYKSFAFKNKEQFEDFLFTGSILNKPFRYLKNTDIVMFVYPVSIKGEEYCAKDYDDFFFEKKDESRFDSDPIFSILGNEGASRFNRFDFVFADNSGNTTTDLIELSAIEKSALRIINQRIENISKEVNLESNFVLNSNSKINNLQIETSFLKILGNTFVDSNGYLVFKPNAKYKSHLLAALPLIYTAKYYNDDLLLPSFVQVSEFIVRNVEKKFICNSYADIKYHFKFLMKIQNSKTDKFMAITTSESYQIGFLLGGMAKNLSQEINSFEKNYVGNLTRRIGSLVDFIKLKNEIEQKLIMHDKSKFTFQTSYELAQKVKEFNTRYDKEECAFGFMESYFKPIPKKDPALKKEDESNNQ